MKTRPGLIAGLALALGVHLLAPAALAELIIGTVGHSLTDEYQRPESNRQRGLDGFNWVEILSRTRAGEVSFGAYDATLDANNEPGGYAYNHAVGGAMVLNSNLPQQVADLAADIAAGEIDAVVIWIGENDFTQRRLRGGSFDLNDPGFQSFQVDFVGTLVNAVDTLIGAGATHIALAKIGADPTRNEVFLATNDTNDQLAAAAAARPQVTFFDPVSELLARYDSASNSFQLDGLAVIRTAAPSSSLVDPPGGVTPAQCGFNNSTNAPGCPTAAYQAYALQDDGAHITTPMQGLVANAVVGALRSRGFSLNSLSDSEILAISGVAPQPPSSSLLLRWASLTSKCKRSTSICRIKGKLLAQNSGVSTSEAMSVSFLLSSDTAADAGDLVLGSGAIRALPPGKRAKLKLRATLPTGVTTDGHYLIAQPTRGGLFIQGPLD